jgi:prolipoprotein diacylglyceryltransferase
VTFALLLIIKQKKLPTGILFLIYNVLYNAERFGLEFLRGDSPRTFGLTAAQWTGIAVFILCILFSISYFTRTNKKTRCWHDYERLKSKMLKVYGLHHRPLYLSTPFVIMPN